jgi:hypothetical protein
MRILLAEDDALLGDGLRAGLRQQGFQVDWVRDGEAAERELRALVRRAHGQPQECLAVQDVILGAYAQISEKFRARGVPQISSPPPRSPSQVLPAHRVGAANTAAIWCARLTSSECR